MANDRTGTDSNVIGSDRVEGTTVYDTNRERIGKVEKLLIEKRSGQVTDAIVSVGGFFGIGNEPHSLPWSMLQYDTDLGGYCIDASVEQLRDAPRLKQDDTDRAYDRNYQTENYNYWGVNPSW